MIKGRDFFIVVVSANYDVCTKHRELIKIRTNTSNTSDNHLMELKIVKLKPGNNRN